MTQDTEIMEGESDGANDGTASGITSSAYLLKIQDFLKAKDDTSKFVGLALLKAFLDNEASYQNAEVLKRLWNSISPTFLDRLLRARRNEKTSEQEAKDMVDLAVAVIHAFSVRLPAEAKRDVSLTKRTGPLVQALLKCLPETTALILQALVSIVSQTEGAVKFLEVEKQPLIQIAPNYPLTTQVFSFAWMNASTVVGAAVRVQQSINDTMPKLLLAFEQTDSVTFVQSIGDLLPNLNPSSIPNDPEWLPDLVLVLRKLVGQRPTLTGRTAYTKLASALLQIFPATTPNLIFTEQTSKAIDTKPFSYLFVNLLLIDLRSSFPSLLEKINSDEYPSISQRLAAAFDVLSSFIGFLVKNLEEEAQTSNFVMPPDLLLKLRKDIAETISLTIEYVRDRWDSAVAGVAGLHDSARSAMAATSGGTRLTLKWDSVDNDVTTDPLILAGIRAMSIWIREDENENLRNEAAGLMDMLLEVYNHSGEVSNFRYPILLALEGILITDGGPQIFLGHKGWEVLSADLRSIFKLICGITIKTDISQSAEAIRAVQIVRVLLAVLDHPSISYPEESWMEAVTLTTSVKVPDGDLVSEVLEALIASLQLSSALLSLSSAGVRKRYISAQPALRGLAGQLRAAAATKNENSRDQDDFMESLDEVTMSLNFLDSA